MCACASSINPLRNNNKHTCTNVVLETAALLLAEKQRTAELTARMFCFSFLLFLAKLASLIVVFCRESAHKHYVAGCLNLSDDERLSLVRSLSDLVLGMRQLPGCFAAGRSVQCTVSA